MTTDTLIVFLTKQGVYCTNVLKYVMCIPEIAKIIETSYQYNFVLGIPEMLHIVIYKYFLKNLLELSCIYILVLSSLGPLDPFYEGMSINNQLIPFSIDRDGHDFHDLFQYMFYKCVINCMCIESFFNKILNVKHG